MSSPPQTLGQYQIIREIARSNDIVYEAYDPLMNRRVAVKELSMPSGSTPQQLEDRINRFRREAQAVGSLNHPNIMTVYSFSEDSGRYFMAMEYLDGVTLRKEIDNSGFLAQDQAIDIISQVLEGLHHAHQEGVVHRDIKPDNIQITTANGVKITDFGIARLTFQPNLTMDGQVFGTPSYMSPEQVVGKEIDQRTDLFSVGVMLYEMLTGNKPFQGDNVIAITHAIVNGSIPPTTQIPSPIYQVITKALEKAPQMRYTNAAEMKVALEDAAQPAQNQHYQNPVAGFDPYSQPPQSLIQPNPYQQANPYQQPDPYALPIQTPYGGVVPSYNPYGQQPMMAPPPVIANTPSYGSYNPYQQPMLGPTPMQQPYNAYYPPPPGPPLISYEAKERMRQFIFAIILFAVIAAILIVAFVTLSSSIKQQQASQGGSPSSSSSGPSIANGGSDNPLATNDAKPPPGRSGAELSANADKALTYIAQSSGHVAAGDAYQQAGDNANAYDEYGKAFNILLANNASRTDLRQVLYKMEEVAAPGSPERDKVDEEMAKLN
ncbi:MAG: protein kinase [Armatimonadetes bacterium]|nr:protein kinase [Armatimonadota bacterium]